MDWKYIESVEQILTESTGIDSRFQIAVRRGQHSHIDGKRMAAADAFKLALLQHSKQSDLRLRGKVANFIEENGSPIGRFKASNTPLYCPGEGALLVPAKCGRY